MQDSYAIAASFVVKVDDFDLGAFSTCDGLGCEIVMEQREEGGNFGHVWQFPSRIKYSNIKLTRPLTADSAKVTKWISTLTGGIKRSTATIEARNGHGDLIASWHLMDALPVKWNGPQLAPDSTKLAMETLELAHHGFLSQA